jgi:hypothetical protein
MDAELLHRCSTSCDRTWLVQAAFAAMTAILFLQSSLDKLFHWKGNKDYLTEHFSKSPLKGTVPLLLPVITLVEFSAGLCSAIGLVLMLFLKEKGIGTWGMLLATAAIILLFFGQRVAKDYAGAAALVPYFLLCAGGLYVFL